MLGFFNRFYPKDNLSIPLPSNQDTARGRRLQRPQLLQATSKSYVEVLEVGVPWLSSQQGTTWGQDFFDGAAAKCYGPKDKRFFLMQMMLLKVK